MCINAWDNGDRQYPLLLWDSLFCNTTTACNWALLCKIRCGIDVLHSVTSCALLVSSCNYNYIDNVIS